MERVSENTELGLPGLTRLPIAGENAPTFAEPRPTRVLVGVCAVGAERRHWFSALLFRRNV